MVAPVRLASFLLLAALGALASRAAPAAPPAGWEQLSVGPMKTSIYVGSVTLTPGPFVRKGDTYTATYEATVWPWFFWGEKGSVTIQVPEAGLRRAARGETVEFAGDGANQKGKPRHVTGRAQPANATTGKLKLRIKADGIELIFNGTYRLGSN